MDDQKQLFPLLGFNNNDHVVGEELCLLQNGKHS